MPIIYATRSGILTTDLRRAVAIAEFDRLTVTLPALSFRDMPPPAAPAIPAPHEIEARV